MSAPSAQTIVLLLLVPLIVWRLYSRIRGMVGRQRLSRVRPWITLTVFPLLAGLLGWFSYPRPESLPWLGGGLAAGAALAVYGLKLTRFERTPQGLFYTPNRVLGLTLVLLLVARIGYRLVEVYALAPAAGHNVTDFAVSPLTLALFGLLAGYYVAYAIGLLLWRYEI